MKRNIKRGIIFLLLISFCSLDFLNICLAKEAISIIPQPQKLIPKNYDIDISNNWRITVDKYNDGSLFSARYLSQKLSDEFGIKLSIEKSAFINAGKRIILGTIQDNLIKEILKREKIDISELVSDEGYILEVFERYIIIVATSSRGVFYGVQTFLQLVKVKDIKMLISAAKIIDNPKTKNRGVHFCGANLAKMKEYLDQMARLKLNFAIIETWSHFNINEGNNRQLLEEIFAYARERYIEPIPQLVSFSYAGPILSIDPYAAEGIWIQDEHFKFVSDEAMATNPTKHSLVNVIRSEDSNISIKNLERTRIYEEGNDYKVIEGIISYPYSLDNGPTKIIRIASGNIKDGEEVLISYNYVERRTSSWAKWTAPYCPSSERTYKIMFGALENVIRALNPKYISIGHDEILGLNRDSRCKKRNLTNAELLAYEINRLNDFVKSMDPNIRLLMWDDMINPSHIGGNENLQVEFGGVPGKTSDAIDLIPKDMIIMIWWYDSNDRINKRKNSPAFFESKGFDYLVAGYKDKKNIKNWTELIENKKRCLGVLTTTWDSWEKNLDGIRYTAEVTWH